MSASDRRELDTVRDGFAANKPGLSAAAANAGIAKGVAQMKAQMKAEKPEKPRHLLLPAG